MFALSKNKRFLCSIKKEVQDLPWALWENEDIENSNYPLKRKNLIGKVMRIENRIRSYVSNKYGSGELLDEFSGYSFFTTKKGYVMDPFNIENNRAWKSGKKAYLYFTDKLLVFAESEDYLNSIDFKKAIVQWIIFLGVVLFSFLLVFSAFIPNEVMSSMNDAKFKFKLQLILGIIMVAFNIIWYKNWKDLLPLTTAILGVLIGANS